MSGGEKWGEGRTPHPCATQYARDSKILSLYAGQSVVASRPPTRSLTGGGEFSPFLPTCTGGPRTPSRAHPRPPRSAAAGRGERRLIGPRAPSLTLPNRPCSTRGVSPHARGRHIAPRRPAPLRWPPFPDCPQCRRRLHSLAVEALKPTADGRCPHCRAGDDRMTAAPCRHVEVDRRIGHTHVVWTCRSCARQWTVRLIHGRPVPEAHP